MTTQAEPQAESPQDRNWRELETERDALRTENTGLKQQLRVDAFDRAGFQVQRNEDGSVAGVGALLADTYSDDDLTTAALKGYAESKGIVPVVLDAAAAPQVEVKVEPTPEEKAAPVIEAAQDRMQVAHDFASDLPAPDELTDLEARVKEHQDVGGPTSQQEIQDALDLHRQLDPRMR